MVTLAPIVHIYRNLCDEGCVGAETGQIRSEGIRVREAGPSREIAVEHARSTSDVLVP